MDSCIEFSVILEYSFIPLLQYIVLLHSLFVFAFWNTSLSIQTINENYIMWPI